MESGVINYPNHKTHKTRSQGVTVKFTALDKRATIKITLQTNNSSKVM